MFFDHEPQTLRTTVAPTNGITQSSINCSAFWVLL